MKKLTLNRLNEIVVICLFFSFLTTSSFDSISYIGYIFMLILYSICSLNLLNDWISGITKGILVTEIFVFSVILLFLLNSNVSITSITTLFQLFFIFSLVRYTKSLDLKHFNSEWFSWANKILMLILYFFSIARIYFDVEIMFHNYASIGPLALCMVIFNFLLFKTVDGYSYINYIGYIPLLILCNGRNVIMCCLIFFLYFKFIDLKSRRGVFFSFLFLCAVIYLVSVEYPQLYGTDIGYKLNALSFSFTNKAFFSGRQLIWKNILYQMEGNELTGFGTGIFYGYFFDDQRSAHNQYLQLYLQNGILGISFLAIALFIMWSSVIKNKLNFKKGSIKYIKCHISESFFVVMVIYNIFSVAMLQNSMTIANFFWYILALGLNSTIPKPKSSM